jgi:hypothetical protein
MKSCLYFVSLITLTLLTVSASASSFKETDSTHSQKSPPPVPTRQYGSASPTPLVNTLPEPERGNLGLRKKLLAAQKSIPQGYPKDLTHQQVVEIINADYNSKRGSTVPIVISENHLVSVKMVEIAWKNIQKAVHEDYLRNRVKFESIQLPSKGPIPIHPNVTAIFTELIQPYEGLTAITEKKKKEGSVEGFLTRYALMLNGQPLTYPLPDSDQFNPAVLTLSITYKK